LNVLEYHRPSTLRRRSDFIIIVSIVRQIITGMMVGENLIGSKDPPFSYFSELPPSLLVVDVKCEEKAESQVVSGVKILDTRSHRYRADACKAEQFQKMEGARGIFFLHAPV